MCVKDEADIILDTLHKWLNVGATHFYICDTGSTDNTWELLHEAKQEGAKRGASFTCKRQWPKEWMNQVIINDMLKFAQNDGISWMFFADADEVLNTQHGYDLHRMMQQHEGPVYGYISYYDNFPNGTRRLNTHKKLFGNFPKGFRPDVSIGNHLALNTKGATEINHNLWYEHYPVRSYEQYKTKLLNISRAFAGTDFARAPHAALYDELGEDYMRELYDNGMKNDIWA